MLVLDTTNINNSDLQLIEVESSGGVAARRSRWRPVATTKLLLLMLDVVHRNLPETVTRV